MSTDRALREAGWCKRDAPRGPTGFRLCRWCGKECPTKARTFCGGARAKFTARGTIRQLGHGCVDEWCLRSDPAYLRKRTLARAAGKCQVCALETDYLEADHIVPVAEGGGVTREASPLDNMQALCAACHRLKTASQARRRAEAKKGSQEGGAQ